MPLPAGVEVIKIHPAIGVARISTNDDYYVYGDPPPFMSNDVIKRQAVQFRLFAYGAGNEAIEELTPQRLTELGLEARWSARVANAKTVSERGDQRFLIEAAATSNVNGGALVGSLADFHDAAQIPLGTITADGLFIPPKALVYKSDPALPIPDSGMFNRDFSDNTCDGPISVELIDTATATSVAIPTFNAWVFVTPPDFAPETDDDEAPPGNPTLEQWLSSLLNLPNNVHANALNRHTRELDRDILRRCTGDFAPGIEASFGGFDLTRIREILYATVDTGDPDEIRIAPEGLGNGGAAAGELTMSLCSPWQFDFRACSCSFWPAQRPDTAFNTASQEVEWLRKRITDVGSAAPRIRTNGEFIEHVHKLGILREQNGKLVETERTLDIP